MDSPIQLSNDLSGSDSSNSSDNEEQSHQTTAAAAIAVKNSKAKISLPVRPSKRKRERKAMQLRSAVWEHFTKFDEPLIAEVDGVNQVVGTTKKASCYYCKLHLACDSRGNGTSSLKKHIEIHCKAYSASLSCQNVEDGKQSHLSSDLVDGFKNMTTRVWSQETCIDAATKMIVIDELPFSAIERRGFKFFCEVSIPKLILPCRKTIVKNFLRMYEEKKQELKNELLSVSVCLTTDTWTSCQNINYMVITAHFIDIYWRMHKRILKFCVIPNHSGSTIGKILEDALIEWGIENVLTISVDNASPNKHAIDYVKRRMLGWNTIPLCGGEFLHVRCLPHVINLIVKSGLREMESSVAAIRNAIRFVRSSAARTEAFKKCVEKDKIECKKICILDVPTRWNSSYMMLDTAIELKRAFQRMEDDDLLHYRSYFNEEEGLDEDEDETQAHKVGGRKIVGPPKDVDWDKAECFVKFLRVFYQVTMNLSASLEPTAHSAFHDIVSIKAELDEWTTYPPDHNSSEIDHILYDMAGKMTTKFNKYFSTLDNINQLFLVALVLDPRYKLKYFERQAERMLNLSIEEVKSRSDKLKELMVKLCDKYGGGSSGCGSSQRHRHSGTLVGVESSSKGRSNANDKMVSGKRKAMLEDWDKQLKEGEELVVGHEVDRYLLDPIEKPKVRAKFKITEWWRDNGSKYPCLQAVARDLLAIQVSTVASESSFSTGKRVIDPYRCSMTPKTVVALICYQNWLISDSIMALEYIPTIEEMEFYEEVENERQEEALKSANNNISVDDPPSADASKTPTHPPKKKLKKKKTTNTSLRK